MIIMMDNNMLILLLFIGFLASQQALSQDVEIRGASDKAESGGGGGGGGGGQRTIYQTPKHSYMHFGKRLESARGVYDLPFLAPQPPQQQSLPPVKYPYVLHFDLERGQQLQALTEPELRRPNGGENIMFLFGRPPSSVGELEASFGQRGGDQRMRDQMLQQVVGQTPMFARLMEANEANGGSGGAVNSESTGGSVERAQPASNAQGDDDDQQAAINLNTRSMHGTNSLISNPWAYKMLYGRNQGAASSPSFGIYRKKAEPKENFFMHFGRK